MKWVKRIFVLLLILITAVLVHYYLPQRDIVKVVGTDVKRMDIGKGSPFWDRQDAGTENRTSRDVRFISTIKANNKTMVYRNEDTGWSFPFYLKFDSSDLSAKAEAMVANKDNDIWVAVTHYGWRIRLFSIFPNATKIKPVAGPDTLLIPWFNIAFLFFLAMIVMTIWRTIRTFKKKRIDPVTDKIEKEIEEAGSAVKGRADSIGKELGDTQSGFRKFLRRWFGSK